MAGPVVQAIERWHEKGLIGPETAEVLHSEAITHEASAGSRRVQYAIAIAAAIITVIAALTAISWVWGDLSDGSQTLILSSAAVGLILLGLLLESRPSKQPPSYLLQMAGLVLGVIATLHGYDAWTTPWAPRLVTGLGLALPLSLLPLTVRRNPVMPAATIAFVFGSLGIFLSAGLQIETDTAIWILDAVVVATVFSLVMILRRGPHRDWIVGMLITGLLSGLVLTIITALGPLEMGERAYLPVDAWYLFLIALTLWSIHRAPDAYRRDWFPHLLAFLTLVAIPLCVWTFFEGIIEEWTAVALAEGVVGSLALWHGLGHDFRTVIYTGCATVVVGAWTFGVSESGALGGSLALAFTALLLFWISGRIGQTE